MPPRPAFFRPFFALPVGRGRVACGRVWLAVLLVSAGMPSGAPMRADAGGNDRPDGHYLAREWLTDDGLPHNAVNAVVRDAKGFLWLGTMGGLARFDGSDFVEFPLPAGMSTNGFNIRALAVDDDDSLLMATANNQVVRLRDGEFDLHPVNATLPPGSLRDLGVGADGSLWFGFDDPAAIVRWHNGVTTVFGANVGVTRRSGRFMFVRGKNGATWMAGGDFLAWHDEDGLHRHTGRAGRSLFIVPSRPGGLWIAAREHLARLENGIWRVVLSGQGWPAVRVGIQDMFEDAAGALWIATRRDGVFRLVDGTLEPVLVPVRRERVLSIMDDIEGNIWLGMNGGGLVRLKPKHHVLLNQAAGLPQEISSSVCEDATGALWCANQAGGLVRVKDGRVDIAATLPAEHNFYANNVCVDRRGRVWVGAISGLYSTPVDGPWTLRREAGETRNVQTLFHATNGDLWLSWNSARLGVLRNGVLREFTADEGFPGSRVAAIAERAGGEIWIGLENGALFRLAGGKLVAEPVPHAARFARLHTLLTDAENRLWIGTSNGLLLWRGARSRLFTRADGLPDDIINQIIIDDNSRLWASSRRGIFHLPLAQLTAAADTPGRGLAPVLLGRDDDLDGVAGFLGAQPMAWKGRDGRVWMATYRGIAGLDPIGPVEKRAPLPVHIDRATVDGVALKPAPGEELCTGAQPRRLELAFAALNFSTPDRTRMRRMLEGFDVGWVDAGRERFCVYPRLPPGRYVFRVEASDGENRWADGQAALAIVVPPAWWQTWWTRAGFLLVFAALVALLARAGSHHLLKRKLLRLQRENALERERARIARDLHDDLGGRMTRIGFVADRLHRKTEDPGQKEQLGRLAVQARYLLEDLEGIIWTVNPQNDSWQRLAAYISRYAHSHLRDTGILCTVDGASDIPDQPISPDVRHHLLAIAKEALNNMLKHSQASRATLSLAAEDGLFHMRLHDDGCGFSGAAARRGDGNGLVNMRTRMAEVGGRIDIMSRPGEGTDIVVDVPMHYRPPPVRQAADKPPPRRCPSP
ncbi:MAG: histidine kinase [Opitutaceae bacterium]|nr:histidine kinase [Opitutaceae bacterium]